MHVHQRLLLAVGTVVALGCAGRQDESGGIKGGDEPEAAPAGQTGEVKEANVTPEMIAMGESIFKGKEAGGICYTCHAADGKGTPTGPNLTDNEWIHGDGSTGQIAKVIREGVMNPKKFSSPMPRFEKQFNDQQIQALSAYVYSLSHPEAGGRQPDQQQPSEQAPSDQPPQ
jgi:mono/diheme cytochrome c family protein